MVNITTWSLYSRSSPRYLFNWRLGGSRDGLDDLAKKKYILLSLPRFERQTVQTRNLLHRVAQKERMSLGPHPYQIYLPAFSFFGVTSNQNLRLKTSYS